jgi:hypothetical protein
LVAALQYAHMQCPIPQSSIRIRNQSAQGDTLALDSASCLHWNCHFSCKGHCFSRPVHSSTIVSFLFYIETFSLQGSAMVATLLVSIAHGTICFEVMIPSRPQVLAQARTQHTQPYKLSSTIRLRGFACFASFFFVLQCFAPRPAPMSSTYCTVRRGCLL